MQSILRNKINLAIIMDGNGRWATRRGLPRSAGHRAGVKALRNAIEAAAGYGAASLTVYAFSSDNWRRPAGEVNALMQLLRNYLARELARLVKSDVRLTVIGRRDRLPPDIITSIERAEGMSKDCRGLHLRIALDYSARDAILRAAWRAAQSRLQDPRTGSPPCDIAKPTDSSIAPLTDTPLTRQEFGQALNEDGSPIEIDLLIRTGGEHRLSDFLLWEAAYAELYFCDKLWPDFGAADLRDALLNYQARDRRFGAAPAAEQPAALNTLLPSLSYRRAEVLAPIPTGKRRDLKGTRRC